ncbi:nuclear transport factor 2 family protein [Nocardia vulneris]|uniref:SnoaL-like domain-containing protein n=1 Tax=Nocardia vulneris TaxID=1141657 RepID=A0ABR4ZFH1_9NOCA|nr:nuclear transport factor 2 family protein [Nocardia vulneris]KIA63754.1 hypothetical protein FG87_18240 [Nocardia vulneris]
MSQINLELVTQVYHAFGARDFSVIERLFDPDIEIKEAAQLPWGGRHVGHAGANTYFGTMLAHIDANVVPQSIFAAGDDVVMMGRGVGTTTGGDVAFDVPNIHVWHLREGRVVGFDNYVDTPAMLAALDGATHPN